MSIEPEDMLEEALRNDFPTADTQARVRRRLLAAGLAVGNGVAATTAAASSAGAAGVVGTAGKIAGLSWGLKLGLAAMVTIPTVGLWLDGRAERGAAVQPPVATPARAVEARPRAVTQSPDATELAPEADGPSSVPEPPQPRAAKAVEAGAPAPANDLPAGHARPSQGDFAPLEPPTRAPRVTSTLAEETRLLDGAFAELAAGNRARAAELINEHEARFPAGLLQKERERAKTRLSQMSRGE
jgi:hypothetical protein